MSRATRRAPIGQNGSRAKEATLGEQLIGTVSHYYTKAGVAAIELTGSLSVGDTIRFVGHTSDFTQQVGSMEIEHDSVETAKAGDHIGVKVASKARQNDRVFRVE